MLETYVFTEDLDISDLPKEGNYYVIADNGTFIHKDTGIFEGFVKVQKPTGLGKLNPRIKPKLPKIPVEVVYKAYCFFREVFHKYQSESCLMLYYNKEKRQYYLYCPEQTVSHGGVDYDQDFDVINNKEHREIANWFKDNGFRRVGSIHSHCDFGAFHSGIDTKDESEKNGIHMTIGHVDSDFPEIVTSFAINDNRFQVDPETVVKGLIKKEGPVQGRSMGFLGMRSQTNENRYDFDLTDEQFDELESLFYPEIEEEWLPLVSKHVYSGWKGSSSNDHRSLYPFSGQSNLIQPVDVDDEDEDDEDRPNLTMYSKGELKKIKSHARALKLRSGSIPIQRIRKLSSTLEDFFEVDKLTSEHINIACSIIPNKQVYED